MNFPHIFYGGDYNPEQWPEETWLEDVHLMKEAGVNLVSLGIFSWAKLEPQPGEFNFAWLDRIMDLLHVNGISVNLATPTASPPPWMTKLHPEMLPITAAGETLWNGSRRHYCPHNPDYRRYALRIAAALAERYKGHPALAMWHVDNEYGCHVGECFCDHSAVAFRDWLKARYSSLDQLNFAWGTTFWGQIYSDWNEIHPPRKSPAHINPTQQLDWARFSSDSWLACFNDQKEVLKKITPRVPVTTNFMCFHKGVDYFKFAQHEDVVSNDSYPDTWQPDWMVQAAMACDLMRSVGRGNPWILMEQSSSQVNWRPINVPKRPGIMRLGSLQAVARGADGIMFFQWRQSKAGAEKHHSGMLPHAGTDSRVWREIKALGKELPRLKAVIGSRVQAEVALLMDWNNWWALEIDSKPSAALKMVQQLQSFYQPFYDRNLTVNFVHPEDDLSDYKLVLAPNLYLTENAAAENIERYVENGGTLLMTYFSAIVDGNEHIRLGGYPAPFRKLLGLTVEEYVPFPHEYGNSVKTTDDLRYQASLWADVIRLQGAEVLAVYETDYYAGLPAYTRHNFGKGTGFYLGTQLTSEGLSWAVNLACKQAHVCCAEDDLPAGVESSHRTDGKTTWLFLMNHNPARVTIPFNQSGTDLLTGLHLSSSFDLEANGAAVIELE